MKVADTIPAALVNAFVEKRASVLVGAGLSAGAGLATWNELTRRLARELPPVAAEESPLKVAQRYRDEFGVGRLTAVVWDELRKLNAHHTEAHAILVGGLHLDEIYTTNFDDLFELACNTCGRRPYPVFDAESFSVRVPDCFRIIKLHGDLNAAHSIVLAETDFKGYLESHGTLATALANEFALNSMLFMGYSFSDPDIRLILERVRGEAGEFAQKHFIVLFDPAEDVVASMQAAGVTVIAVPGNGDLLQASIEWLSQLQHLVAQKRSSQGTTDNEPAAMPKRPVDLIGRDEYVDSVMRALDDERAVMISGLAGMGKTSSAVAVAQRWLHRDAPRSRVVWFAARERSGATRWLNEVLDAVAAELGFADLAKRPPDELAWKRDAVAGMLSSLDTPVLVVLDNLETIPAERLGELAEWIATVPPPSCVLVTSRPLGTETERRLVSRVMELPGLDEPDAIHLLQRYAAERVDCSGTLAAGGARYADVAHGTLGNPEAMKLAFRLVQQGDLALDDLLGMLSNVRAAATDAERLDMVFGALLDRAWKSLSTSAQRLMMSVALFISPTIPRGLLVRTAGLDPTEARAATEQATQLGLLDPALDEKSYAVHPKTREYAVPRLRRNAEFHRAARRRCAEEYLKFVKQTVEGGRRLPDVRYWKSLVSADMRNIDPEWPMIREQLEWASRNDVDLLREFVVYLVHYMDSRCLNADRLRYATAVVEAYGDEECPEDLALLRIDALAWTYLEEGKLAEAELEIERGEMIAEYVDEGSDELLAVAKAWKAVARTRLGFADQGRQLIDEAKREATGLPAWIRMRIAMAAGDLALASGDAYEAFKQYGDATDASAIYNDGLGYQLYPRMGLALVMLPERLPDDLNKAHRNFDAIRGRGVPSGKLYGDYGLGLVEYARGRIEKGMQLMTTAREALSERRASSLLRALMDELYERVVDTERPDEPGAPAVLKPPRPTITPAMLVALEADPEELEMAERRKKKRSATSVTRKAAHGVKPKPAHGRGQ